MTRVAVLQSNYLPWKGYFDIVNSVDLFVFYDDVQYTKNDWRNRNCIQTAQGPQWLTIPVGPSISRRICDVELTDSRWQLKHWKTITQTYSHAPCFTKFRTFLDEILLAQRWDNLSSLNQTLIRRIATEFLGITTKFVNSRDFALSGTKGERLLNLLMSVGATQYLSGPSAQDYLDRRMFEEHGIQVDYIRYDDYPEYPQRHRPFVHQVSVIDLLFNVGARAPDFIWGHRLVGQ